MTSAVRDAANGAEFARRVTDALGFPARILAGEDEAKLTFAGAIAHREEDAPVLVIDIGGGSTELVIGVRDQVTFHVSTQIGVVRHAERHLHSDPPSADELAALRADVTLPAHPRAGKAIAVAGTPTQCAAIDLGLEQVRPSADRGPRPDPRAPDGALRAPLAPAPRGAPAGPRTRPRSGTRDRCGNRHPARSTGVLRPPTGRSLRARHPLRTRALNSGRRTDNRVQNVREWTCVRLAVQRVKVENHACRKGGRASRRRPPTHRSWRCRIIGASRRQDHPIRPHQGTYPCPS